MNRVVNVAALVAAVCGAAMSASADVRERVAVEPEALGSRFATRGAVDGIGFEAGEGFVLGDIAGQNGWLTNSNPLGDPPVLIGDMRVTDGVNDGNGSANALRFSVGPQAQGTSGIAQAPLTLGSNQVTVDTKIDDDFGANYFVRGLALASGGGATLSFRVEFDYRGSIFVQNPSSGVFTDTLAAWGQGLWRSLDVVIINNASDSAIDYFYDGNLIFQHTGLPAGLYLDVVQFGHDNFQAIGNGSFTGEPVPAGYFDNLRVVPTPGAAGLLAMGGLLTVRRRRR